MSLNKIVSNVSYLMISLQIFIITERKGRIHYPRWNTRMKVEKLIKLLNMEGWRQRLELCPHSQIGLLGSVRVSIKELALWNWKRTDMLSGLIHLSQSWSKWIPEKSNNLSGAHGHILQYNNSVLLHQTSFLGKMGILVLGNKVETKIRNPGAVKQNFVTENFPALFNQHLFISISPDCTLLNLNKLNFPVSEGLSNLQ